MTAIIINLQSVQNGKDIVRRIRLAQIEDVERHREKIAAIKNSLPVAKLDEAIFAAIDAHCAAVAAYHEASTDEESERAMQRQDELTLSSFYAAEP
jgi:hypothetical protein